MRWTDRAVRTALGLPGPYGDVEYAGISTDTRAVPAGSLFVALKGERYDAHDFLEQAATAGAAGAVVRRGTAKIPGLVLYPVDDTQHALGELAHARRKAIPGPVIAITGTNGKTSTKEMIAAALRTRYRVAATRINLNNLVGVPLTILEAPEDTEALVLEAGANLRGEMARHREVIDPSIAVITNVGRELRPQARVGRQADPRPAAHAGARRRPRGRTGRARRDLRSWPARHGGLPQPARSDGRGDLGRRPGPQVAAHR